VKLAHCAGLTSRGDRLAEQRGGQVRGHASTSR
jgi:hypothetical protein